jgi:hypothetical protein
LREAEPQNEKIPKLLHDSWSEKGFQEEIVRMSVLRAAEEAERVATVEEASEAHSKARATSSASVATLTTWNLASAQSTDVFYSEESNSDDENSVSVSNRPSSKAVEKPIGDAVASIQAEISELDTSMHPHCGGSVQT